MLYNVFPLLILLLTSASGESANSFHRRLPTEKPNILQEDPIISKSIDPPTHISEFTDPDTGLNPFLDLEEGPPFIGRNVMKDEHRERPVVSKPPFMDFELVEGDSSDRRWKVELDYSRKPLEESVPLWIPFEAGHPEIKLEDEVTTLQPSTTESDEPTTWLTTILDDDTLFGNEISSEEVEQKSESELPTTLFSNVMILCTALSVGILTIILLVLGVLWWRRKMTRTSRLSTTVENGELKC